MNFCVDEFAIGMGPKIFSRTRGETAYSLRLLPIGGFVSLEGEDIYEPSGNPRSFSNKPYWQRVIVLAAGSAMNLLLGFLILLILFMPMQEMTLPVIDHFADQLQETGLGGMQVGDRILAVNGEGIYVTSDVAEFMQRYSGRPYDIKIKRAGRTLTLEDVTLNPADYTMDGEAFRGYGLSFTMVSNLGFFDKAGYAFNNCRNLVRSVRLGLGDLFRGDVGVGELSGPVGITAAIGEISRVSISSTWYFVALITLNLAVMNMLPIPGLDGGRLLFVTLSSITRKIRGRAISPKFEAVVNGVGLLLLFGLMAFVTYNDIVRLVTRG